VTRATRLAMRIGTLALALVIVAFLTSAIPFRQIIDQRHHLEEAKEKLAALELENSLLTAEVSALQTPAEIERMAREKLGYVMPGEVAFVVFSPDTDSAIADVETPAPESSPWWRQLWDYLTGADGSG
jgi:cell division protein FtsB